MKLYLDVSCLNRPFDNQHQARVRIESEAVLLILHRIDQGIHRHVSSEMAVAEIDSIADLERRDRILSMLPPQSDIMPIHNTLLRRTAELQLLGIKAADAVHVGAAELHRADAFLTCDDKLLRVVRRHRNEIGVVVSNPVAWVENHEQT